VKAWKKIYQANGPPKQAGVAILKSDKVDFTPKLIKRDKKNQKRRSLHTNKRSNTSRVNYNC
jgi:hypothetical protein